MAFTTEDRRKLDALYTSWFGEEGRGGYIDRFEALANSHYRLKRFVYVAFGVVTAGYGGVTAFLARLFNGG